MLRQAQQPQAQPPKSPAGETRTLSLSKRPLWGKADDGGFDRLNHRLGGGLALFTLFVKTYA